MPKRKTQIHKIANTSEPKKRFKHVEQVQPVPLALPRFWNPYECYQNIQDGIARLAGHRIELVFKEVAYNGNGERDDTGVPLTGLRYLDRAGKASSGMQEIHDGFPAL